MSSWRRFLNTVFILATLSSACKPAEASPTPEGCSPPAEAGNPAIPGQTVDFLWQKITDTQPQFFRRYTHGSDSYTFTITHKDGKTIFSAIDAQGNPLNQWASTDKKGGLLLAFPLKSDGVEYGPVFVYLCGGSSSDTLYFDDQMINSPIRPQPQALVDYPEFPSLRRPIPIN